MNQTQPLTDDQSDSRNSRACALLLDAAWALGDAILLIRDIDHSAAIDLYQLADDIGKIRAEMDG